VLAEAEAAIAREEGADGDLLQSDTTGQERTER
jgi:hypothetical protein